MPLAPYDPRLGGAASNRHAAGQRLMSQLIPALQRFRFMNRPGQFPSPRVGPTPGISSPAPGTVPPPMAPGPLPGPGPRPFRPQPRQMSRPSQPTVPPPGAPRPAGLTPGLTAPAPAAAPQPAMQLTADDFNKFLQFFLSQGGGGGGNAGSPGVDFGNAVGSQAGGGGGGGSEFA